MAPRGPTAFSGVDGEGGMVPWRTRKDLVPPALSILLKLKVCIFLRGTGAAVDV